MATQPFCPVTTTIAPAGAASAATEIVNARSGAPVRVKSRGAEGEVIYFWFGGEGVEATVNSMSIDPGGIEPFTLPEGATHVATLSATGTPDLEVTVGRYGA